MPAPGFDLRSVFSKYEGKTSEMSDEELRLVMMTEMGGGLPGELPIEVAADRERSLESPFFFATRLVDPFYLKHFEEIHRKAMDEVMAPYLLGETVKLDGVSHDPKEYLGLMVLWSRTTFKSTMLGLLLAWLYLYEKLRLKRDTRAMYVHQVIEKAIERGEVIRNLAKQHKGFRATFPEFRSPSGEWDRQDRWRWPCFDSFTATEWSFKAYGESSDKTGGHYTVRLVDDWETEQSVTTPPQLEKSHNTFRMMDNLKTLTLDHNPLLIAGTHYHYQGTYKRLEKQGGYLVWRVPAHTGSPKRIFDLCAVNTRTEEGRRKVEVGLRSLEKDPPGTLNFPDLLPWRKLFMTAKAQGNHIYACQQLLDPVPEGEQRFSAKMIDGAWVEEIPPPAEMWLYMRCDPAISPKKSACDTGIHLAGVNWQGYRWFLDGWAGREKRPTEQVRKMFSMVRKWQGYGYRVQNIGIESVQYQEALAQLCRDGVPEREATHHGESVRVVKAPCAIRSITRGPGMTKEERNLQMDGPISRGEVKIFRKNPIGEKFATQLKNFPMDLQDLVDPARDMWDGVIVPPRPMTDASPEIPKYIQEMMGESDGESVLKDTSNTVSLAQWR